MGVSIDVMNLLTEWIFPHLNEVDKKYRQFFNERGLT